MSREYIVLADVEGQIRAMRLVSNASEQGIERLSREMAKMIFQPLEIGQVRVEPWPRSLILAEEVGSDQLTNGSSQDEPVSSQQDDLMLQSPPIEDLTEKTERGALD